MLAQIGLVVLGSVLGGLLRWAVYLVFAKFGTGFPWGTLFVNLTGCLLLGWLSEQPFFSVEKLRLVLVIGFIGSYTTFSAFEYESNLLFAEDFFKAITYIFGSVFLGLLAVRLGIYLAQIGGGNG